MNGLTYTAMQTTVDVFKASFPWCVKQDGSDRVVAYLGSEEYAKSVANEMNTKGYVDGVNS